MANKKENKNVQEITVKIEGQEWKDALDKAFEKANKKAKIDGFRPGKAPKDVFVNFIIEITNLNGREIFDEGVDVSALIEVEE
mgnify:CR=1 FL=1